MLNFYEYLEYASNYSRINSTKMNLDDFDRHVMNDDLAETVYFNSKIEKFNQIRYEFLTRDQLFQGD